MENRNSTYFRIEKKKAQEFISIQDLTLLYKTLNSLSLLGAYFQPVFYVATSAMERKMEV